MFSMKGHYIPLVLIAVYGYQKQIGVSQFIMLNCTLPFLKVTQRTLPYTQRIFRDHTYIIAQGRSYSEDIVTIMS